ncbi:MAG TPA: hypothetical protein VGA62_00080 [Acidimicrobiia bacterium]
MLSGLDAVDVSVLGGGVSADVFAVDSGALHIVIKQALGQLKVATTWEADPGRIVVEAAALRLAGTIAPGSVPAVYDIDPERYALVIERAPEDFRNWKDDLLADRIHTDVAARLGTLLATWHSATTDRHDLVGRFGDKAGFVELRIEPFYRSVARKHPALQHGLSALSERWQARCASSTVTSRRRTSSPTAPGNGHSTGKSRTSVTPPSTWHSCSPT